MADNNSSPVCGACKFFLSSGDFGICRRFPSYEQRHASNWCGEHYPIPHVVPQPVEPVIELVEPKKRGRPAKGQSMTRDFLAKLIYDNELFHGTVGIGVVMDMNHVEKLAKLVAAEEREKCAKLMDEMNEKDNLSNYYKVAANKIRTKGES